MEIVLFYLGGVSLGALAGYVYYRLIGCRSGVCPLVSTMPGAILVGAAAGFFVTRRFLA